MEGQPRHRQCAGQRDPHPAVGVLVPDVLRRRVVGVEQQPVVEVDPRDGLHGRQNLVCAVRDLSALKIDVAGRAPRVVGSQQDSAFEYEFVRVRGGNQTGEEALQRVDLVQFVGRAALAARQVLQVEVGTAGNRVAGGLPGHSRISSASRRAFSACGK